MGSKITWHQNENILWADFRCTADQPEPIESEPPSEDSRARLVARLERRIDRSVLTVLQSQEHLSTVLRNSLQEFSRTREERFNRLEAEISELKRLLESQR